MSEVMIFCHNGEVRISNGRGHIVVPCAKLVDGAVFDFVSKGPTYNGTFRAWVDDNSLFVLNLFAHDISWPHDVYEFSLNFKEINEPLSIVYLHEFLAKGNGVPAVPK